MPGSAVFFRESLLCQLPLRGLYLLSAIDDLRVVPEILEKITHPLLAELLQDSLPLRVFLLLPFNALLEHSLIYTFDEDSIVNAKRLAHCADRKRERSADRLIEAANSFSAANPRERVALA